MYIKYTNGNFYCKEVSESAIEDLQHGNGPIMVINCGTPFKGTPKELAASAVEHLNKMFQVERQFNCVLESFTEAIRDTQLDTRRVVFQMV